MKITLELLDETTCVGLFINFKASTFTVTSTNWLTKAEDGKIIRLLGSGEIIEEKD